jgi:segregation and condensation protein A
MFELKVADTPADVFAVVNGQVLSCLPRDLYIPPDALKVFLETFEGPLDLLLYLIKKQRLDILNIPIAQITLQYMKYVELIREFRFELAAEYLVMAAVLAEIKSRLLLPASTVLAEDEVGDPRAELVRRLQEYERFQQAAQSLDELPRLERDYFLVSAESLSLQAQKILPAVQLEELMRALQTVLIRADRNASHRIEHEALSVHERMSAILLRIKTHRVTPFVELFMPEEGRPGVVVTFIAILELLKQSLIDIVQTELFAPISIGPV